VEYRIARQMSKNHCLDCKLRRRLDKRAEKGLKDIGEKFQEVNQLNSFLSQHKLNQLMKLELLFNY
jgi:hypothetical protein